MTEREQAYKLQEADTRQAQVELESAQALYDNGHTKMRGEREQMAGRHASESCDLLKAIAAAKFKLEREKIRLQFTKAAAEAGCDIT